VYWNFGVYVCAFCIATGDCTVTVHTNCNLQQCE